MAWWAPAAFAAGVGLPLLLGLGLRWLDAALAGIDLAHEDRD